MTKWVDRDRAFVCFGCEELLECCGRVAGESLVHAVPFDLARGRGWEEDL